MYKKARKGLWKHWDFLLIDCLCIVIASALSAQIGQKTQDTIIHHNLLIVMMGLIVLDVFAATFVHTFKNVTKRGYLMELRYTLWHVITVFALVTLCMMLLREWYTYSPRRLAIFFLIYGTLSYTGRVIWKALLCLYHMNREQKKSLLIITTSQAAGEIVERIQKYSHYQYLVSGLVLIDRDAKGETLHGVQVVANLDDAADYMCRAWTDEVLFFHTSLDERTQDLLAQCREMAVTIHLYISLQGVEERKQLLEKIGGYEVVTVNMFMMEPAEAFIKRMFDIVAGLFGGLLALLIMMCLGPIIYIQSPGPILFRQKRVGENGKVFTVYKLRTMYPNADEIKTQYAEQNSHSDGLLFKMDFDPRVIGNKILPDGTKKKGIGDFIRRTSLDEFPQFFNVLKSEMSVVGTRPPTLDEWEHYKLHHRARMSIKPGLTGLWQINERKDEMDFEEVVKLDTEYIAHWSITEDVRIILATALSMLRHIGGNRKGS